MKITTFLTLFIIIGLGFEGGYTQVFRFSEGLYRVPYEDGTAVRVSNDAWSHNPIGRFDLIAAGPNKKIVAAAGGWIRGIEESFDTSCFSPCCPEFNNYVIIQHPNGEWSGYTHIQQGSATLQGISLNQWVPAGTPIGIEGTVGCSSGNHLHLQVTRPSDPMNAFAPIGGFLFGEDLIPVICSSGTNQSYFVATAGYPYTGSPCEDNCPLIRFVNQSLGNGDELVSRADLTVRTVLGPVVFASGSASQFRSGQTIILQPGFHARSGSKFQALIKGCNEQN